MAEETPVAYEIVAKRDGKVVFESAVKAANLRDIVRTLKGEMLVVEYKPLNELPEGLE